MPDHPEPKRRSRGPAAGHLWAGQAGPEAPTLPAHQPEAPTSRRSVFVSDPEPQPEPAPAPERRPRVWPKALVGGAVSGLAVALAAFLVAGPLTDGNERREQPAPPAVAASSGAKNSNSVGTIYASASPAVASVQTSGGAGTGFLIDRDGTIVTNAHVVGESSQVRIRFGDDGDV